ncbi:MAG: aminopeptidase [Anaerolineales bacterium]|nr:aminopeptidase [Anaerolineales bacterium]
MTDYRVENLARILVQYSTKIRPKDRVAILGQPAATPLIREVYREVLRAGGYPYVLLASVPTHMPGLADLGYLLLSEGNDDQLQHVNPFTKMVMENFDARIVIQCSTNTRSWSQVDPTRLTLRSNAHKDVIKTYRERSASGELRWVSTLFPTTAYAQDAEMSLTEFEDYVYATTYADTEDPVAEWNAIHEYQKRPIDWLAGKKEISVTGPNIDLKLSIEDRKFLNADGSKNMPSGEIFTSPVEDSINGWVRFTYPAVRRGREVNGIELRFENGKVVEASAEKGEDYLLAMLDTDPGARYIGEFAIGTNKKIDRFIKSILFDEKIGGTIHMAIGYGFAEAGSKNESSVHWDMICDMQNGGKITVDGVLFYDSGEFKI